MFRLRKISTNIQVENIVTSHWCGQDRNRRPLNTFVSLISFISIITRSHPRTPILFLSLFASPSRCTMRMKKSAIPPVIENEKRNQLQSSPSQIGIASNIVQNNRSQNVASRHRKDTSHAEIRYEENRPKRWRVSKRTSVDELYFFVPFLRYRVNSICLNKYTYRGYKRTIDGKEFSILVDLVYVAVYDSFKNENFPQFSLYTCNLSNSTSLYTRYSAQHSFDYKTYGTYYIYNK